MERPRLDYGPRPKWYQRRRGRSLAVAILVLLAGASVWMNWGATVSEKVKDLHWQHRCLTYCAPSDQVVFEEEPSEVAKLRAGNTYQIFGGNSLFLPRPLPAVKCRIGAGAFLHERRTKAG